MPGSLVHRILFFLAVCALVAVAWGLPRSGSLGSPELEACLACSGHVLFAVAALGAALTSSIWKAEKNSIIDNGWPSLRSMAVATPLIVLVQVALGAAYHYDALGAVPHIVWAFLAAIVVMMLAVFVLTHAQTHGPMRKLAIVLLSLIGVQIVAGVAALLARTASADSTAWARAVTVLHTGTGALVFAFTVILSALILHCVQPVAEAPPSQLASPEHNS